jgi:hypothetical protein
MDQGHREFSAESQALVLIDTTSPCVLVFSQNLAHASISCRRFWNRSPRR